MELKKEQEGNKLIVSVSGRLDTNAAPIMMKELEELLVDPVKEFELEDVYKRQGVDDLEPYANMLLKSGDTVRVDAGSMTLKLDEDKYCLLYTSRCV